MHSIQDESDSFVESINNLIHKLEHVCFNEDNLAEATQESQDILAELTKLRAQGGTIENGSSHSVLELIRAIGCLVDHIEFYCVPNVGNITRQLRSIEDHFYLKLLQIEMSAAHLNSRPTEDKTVFHNLLKYLAEIQDTNRLSNMLNALLAILSETTLSQIHYHIDENSNDHFWGKSIFSCITDIATRTGNRVLFNAAIKSLNPTLNFSDAELNSLYIIRSESNPAALQNAMPISTNVLNAKMEKGENVLWFILNLVNYQNMQKIDAALKCLLSIISPEMIRELDWSNRAKDFGKPVNPNCLVLLTSLCHRVYDYRYIKQVFAHMSDDFKEQYAFLTFSDRCLTPTVDFDRLFTSLESVASASADFKCHQERPDITMQTELLDSLDKLTQDLRLLTLEQLRHCYAMQRNTVHAGELTQTANGFWLLSFIASNILDDKIRFESFDNPARLLSLCQSLATLISSQPLTVETLSYQPAIKNREVWSIPTFWLLLTFAVSLQFESILGDFLNYLEDNISATMLCEQNYFFTPLHHKFEQLTSLQVLCILQPPTIKNRNKATSSLIDRLCTHTDSKTIKNWIIYQKDDLKTSTYHNLAPLITSMTSALYCQPLLFDALQSAYKAGFPEQSGIGFKELLIQYAVLSYLFITVHDDHSVLDKFLNVPSQATLKELVIPDSSAAPEDISYHISRNVTGILTENSIQKSYGEFFTEAINHFLKTLVLQRDDLTSLEQFSEQLPNTYKVSITEALARKASLAILPRLRFFCTERRGKGIQTPSKHRCSPQ